MLQQAVRMAAVFCLGAIVVAAAQDPFIGAWKLDSSRSRTPDEMKVTSKGGNTYIFDFGGGGETIVADGTDQKGLQGSLLSVKQEAADTWIVSRKFNGRLMLRATWKLSADGRTLTDYYREFETDGTTVSLDYVYERTGGTGSGFAADWQSIKETNNSVILMQVNAFGSDGLSFISDSGKRVTNVKFDGKDYPNEGPDTRPGDTSSVRRADERNLVITNKANEKVMNTQDFGLSPDGKTLTITLHFTRREKPNVLVFTRQ